MTSLASRAATAPLARVCVTVWAASKASMSVEKLWERRGGGYEQAFVVRKAVVYGLREDEPPERRKWRAEDDLGD